MPRKERDAEALCHAALRGFALVAQHAASLGIARLFKGLRDRGHTAYVDLQREEWAEPDLPTKSHHFFSGVPYHQHLGKAYDASRLGGDVKEDVPEATRV